MTLSTESADMDPSMSSRGLRLQQLNRLLEHSTTYAQIIAARFEEERDRQRKALARRVKKAAITSQTQDDELALLNDRQKGKSKSSRKSRRPLSIGLDSSLSPENHNLTLSKRSKRKIDVVVDVDPLDNLLDQAPLESSRNHSDKAVESTNHISSETSELHQPSDRDDYHETMRELNIDQHFQGTLRQYQIDGIRWLDTLYSNGLNGILGDEMGLGKTIQTIGFLCRLRAVHSWGYFLIIAPLSTIDNWANEFKTFAPSIPIILYHGTQPERSELQRKLRSSNFESDRFQRPVIITSYEMVNRDLTFFKSLKDGYKFMVVDEGHRLKNHNCLLIRSLKALKSENRILLTGTPLQNNLAELWSLLNFLIPEIFDDLDRFLSWFSFSVEGTRLNKEEILLQEEEDALVSKMHAILQPFMLRRIKSDVMLDLPPKKEYVVYTRLAPKQKLLYDAIKDGQLLQYLHEIHGLPFENLQDKSVIPLLEKSKRHKHIPSYEEVSDDCFFNSLEENTMPLSGFCGMSETDVKKSIRNTKVHSSVQNKVMNLRKACLHPYLFPHPDSPTVTKANSYVAPTEALVKASGKMLLLDRVLHALFANNHKVLIFSQMTRMLDILEDYLTLRGWGYCRLDGQTAQTVRREQIYAFNTNPTYRVFLLSTRAGGLGINLTSADTVIIFDSDWNPQQDLQAQDRVHRIGQSKPVIVLRFVTDHSIEEVIFKRAQAKRQLEKMVVLQDSFSNPTQRISLTKADSTKLLDILVNVLKEVDGQSVQVLQDENTNVISDYDLYWLLDRTSLRPRPTSPKKSTKGSNVATTHVKSSKKRAHKNDQNINSPHAMFVQLTE